MSRSSKLTQQQQQQLLLAQQQQQMAENDAAALAAEMFDLFCVATTMRQVLGLYRNMCDAVGLRAAPLNEFYPKLKTKIRSWKAQALWKKFDARASHRVYNKGTACTGTRVLVIGAGPCGLRTAIEAQLLGAKVVVVEKRDRISRNNVLHLWPFVITDLRNLGAKKFYGKFCAGSIDHISIRQLQCILLKVALLLGVEIHEGVSFDSTIEPSDGCGWRAAITPEDHAVSHYEFDVLIGADGKRNTLEGFKRKEFRGKLAIAITANFINKKTEAEAKAEEISGVAFIFNQSFFKELYQTTGIDLENIVYYKDETHYFVMTAKKHSLIDKGVILQDFADPAELLASVNVNTEKLLDYAREAAEFSTKYQMPNLEFAVNHYGKPDVAMFDFTSMFAAETSSRVLVRKNYRLLQCLVGDSLLEPFWPTGSGCARGFLSSMDAAYAIKLWNNTRNSILGVLAQRESMYRLLAQTTPENLQRDTGAYTVDPATRYPNLNRTSVNAWQVKHLIDSDDKAILDQTFMDANALQPSAPETPVRRKRRTGDTLPLSAVLLRWVKAQLHSHEFTYELTEVSDCFTKGLVLCALINRYRPDLVDLNQIKDCSPIQRNELAFKILDKDLRIPRVMSAKDSINLENVDSKIWLNYLEQICEVFRGEIPHVKHPKLDVSELRTKTNNAPDFSKLLKISSKKAKSPMQDAVDMPNAVQRRSVLDEEKLKRQRKYAAGAEASGGQFDTPRRAKKRRSAEKSANIEERTQRLQEIEANRQERQSKRRQQRAQQTQNFYKSIHMLQANILLRESDDSSPFEDYSIYLYRQQAPEFNDRVKDLEKKLLFPDRERGIQSAMPRGADEQFSDRIKNMEQRIRTGAGSDKKPKDLMRAIGKIDSSDWNVREIEKKIQQSKKTEIGSKGREKVPKWSKEQFQARHNKMSKPERQSSTEEKFKEIDQTLKNLDKQLKEGHNLDVGERGRNKVASIAGNFVKKDDTSEEKTAPVVAKSNSKVALALKKQSASEKCHFCKQTVYLMERVCTENLILHRSCLKCHHCHTNLRPGGYAFDRDDPVGRFYCTQHFRLPAKAIRPVARKPQHKKATPVKPVAPGVEEQTPEKPKGRAESLAQLDLLDRGQTPERIEFENADAMSDGEPSLHNVIDENEWTDRNFVTDSEDSESELSSSDDSDDETDSDMFEEANGSPIGVQTLQLATDWIGKQKYSNANSDDSDNDFYDSSEDLLDDDNDDSQTEGEELKKAREMRREEVRLLPLPTNLPTDTETEVEKKAESNSVNNINNSNSNLSDAVKPEFDKMSIKSFNSDRSAKAEIEQIERKLDRKVSSEIDALNEKLYNMNNLIKLSKDVESLKKVNLVKEDIKKKLSLKEQWLSAQAPKVEPKKVEPKVNADETKAAADKMKIEEILEIVKNVDISKNEEASPKSNKRRMSESLKSIEVKNFAETMDTIKAQMVTPKMSKQSSVDLSKYFPNKASEKSVSNNVNKNQVTLKDVNLSKYFPQSPVVQRKVVTVADKLRQSQNEKKPDTPFNRGGSLKRQTSVKTSSNESLTMFKNQLDGAVDIKRPVKKQVKIVKKIVPRKKKVLNEEDKILNEILKDDHEIRSPSREYQRLFQEEKSPSEDISDKIEKILQETGIDLGLPSKSEHKLTKAKSLGSEEQLSIEDFVREDRNKPKGVQGILKRFESFNSDKSDEKPKLRRIDCGSTGSVNRSIESLQARIARRDSASSAVTMSRESLVSVADSVSELEKTMEYLKSEWRTEATNFLQKKRDSFYSKKKQEEGQKSVKQRVEEREEDFPKFKFSSYFFPKKANSPPKGAVAKKVSPAKVVKKTSPSKKTSAAEKKKEKTPEVKKVSPKKKTPEKKLVAKVAPIKKTEAPIKKTEAPVKPPRKPKSPEQSSMEVDDLFNKMVDDMELEGAVGIDLGVTQSSVVTNQLSGSVEHLKTAKKQTSDVKSDLKIETYGKEVAIKDSLQNEKPSTAIYDDGKSINKEMSQNETLKAQIYQKDTTKYSKNSQHEDLKEENHQMSNLLRQKEPFKEETILNSQETSSISLETSSPQKIVQESPPQTLSPQKSPPSTPKSKEFLVESPEKEKSQSFNEDVIKDRLQQKRQSQIALVEDSSPSKSPSVEPTTIRLRGSSEDESIEQLFDQLTDDMLVDVEFDSNDDLIAITPRAVLQKEPLFPNKPQRRHKSSTSSSVSPRKSLSKLDPSDMPPSVQEVLSRSEADQMVYYVPVEDPVPLKFPSRYVFEADVAKSATPDTGHQEEETTDVLSANITSNDNQQEVLEPSPEIIVQSDSDSSSSDDDVLNSATEISTDSEFDQDPIAREAPKIFIDDTHLRKPTKVQIKQGVIGNSPGESKPAVTNNNNNQTAFKQYQQQLLKKKEELEFKPLVQVDPTLLSNRVPFKNPNPGDYLLNKTASTEGIASKKSLELKKRYLLGGEQANGNKIMKSGSTSILDSKLRSFHSNISECQKLLNPSQDISSTMKTFMDRKRLGESVLETKKVEISIEKKNSDEKENEFVTNKNELNKGMEYSETVNTTLVESLTKTGPTSPLIETVDLLTPEKNVPIPIIDLNAVEIPSKMLDSNKEFIKNLKIEINTLEDGEVVDLTLDSPVKSDRTVIDENSSGKDTNYNEKPDISKDAVQVIPDILTQVEMIPLLPREEKKDSPEKSEEKECDIQETRIEVPNIPWGSKKPYSDTLSSSVSSSTSCEDIQHYILDSTTSPDTQSGQVVPPRLEVHDSSGTLMQIDSLMIIDGKYIGDIEDLKHMEIPEGLELPKPAEVKPDKPYLPFDTKNENKIDSLRNLPLIIEKPDDSEKAVKPSCLDLKEKSQRIELFVDRDKTPTAEPVPAPDLKGSDSETEMTGQGLTETELSDWTADDAISENFVDIEFVLNSNKGTIKRNKKGKKRATLPSAPPPPVPLKLPESHSPRDCGILRNLDIEEIEFMDTGSEGSCHETYAATNTTMLKSRGYIEFIELPGASGNRYYSPKPVSSNKPFMEPVKPKREIAGVDYIEQGACILQNDYDLKTPVNESPLSFAIKSQTHIDSTNDIDDDSLGVVTNSQGAGTASNTNTVTTTTEESEALTVVTSPLDSSSPKTQENFNLTITTITTPSSSDRIEKTSSSSASNKHHSRKSSNEDVLNSSKRIESACYEDFVRKLQQEITEITDLQTSSAKDSIDCRKQKRKSSKGDMTIERPAEVAPKVTVAAINVAQTSNKVPEIPTLSRKLEEITKERTKQKDLIHDLVMDKLQSKKQLNAEKRLNRSRNRSLFSAGGMSLSPTPKIAANGGCTNAPHYHVPSSSSSNSTKENNYPLATSKSKESAPEVHITTKARPFSENLDPTLVTGEMYKLAKAQSFSYQPLKTIPSTPATANTDKLRADARARARLKSNQELGLSPEEKLQLLRKRYHIDLQDTVTKADLRARERKMVTSKSVNDISASHRLHHLKSDENLTKASHGADFTSDPNLLQDNKVKSRRHKDPERRKSLIQAVSSFFNKGKKEKEPASPTKESAASSSQPQPDGVFNRFRISTKSKEKSKEKEGASKHHQHQHPERSISQDYINNKYEIRTYSSSPQLFKNASSTCADDQSPPPIPPLPLNYQRSDDESNATESREQKKQRALSKASRQAELKRLRIAQEIQREQEEIEVQLKELEAQGVLVEKKIRGELEEGIDNVNTPFACDEKLLPELFEIWGSITKLKKRDEELGIRQQELQLEHRHAQLKEELNTRLSYGRLDKSTSDVAAEGAILNEMLEIVAKRAALRPSLPSTSADDPSAPTDNDRFATRQSPLETESNV